CYTKVVSMVTIPIYQASSSVPLLLTPVIDILPPKLASSTTQAPIFTATTTITPTTLPPPPQQQSTTESELVEHVVALEKKLSDLEYNNKNLDNTTQNLGSRVYTLELRDLPYKINEAVCKNVKEAVQIALQAPLRDRFRDFSKEDMKEIVHQRMFDTGSYKSLSEHIALYEALDASMERAQRDKLLAEKDKSRKRRRDDQDPPPPPPNSDLKDTDSAHLLKTKSHIPDAVNNWANALATTYQALAENSLLVKTGDIWTFMNWYCQNIGKTELTQADLEGQAYEVKFYIDRHTAELSRKVVRTHMRILSVVRINAHSRYGYDYLKDITLRRADHQEYMIAKKDFKNLYASDFEDLNLLLLQGHLNHLLGSNIHMLSTTVKLWTRNLVIRQRVKDF
ncbi:hypothetical protein Tco_0986064, partial [Tanacetum coccineum]